MHLKNEEKNVFQWCSSWIINKNKILFFSILEYLWYLSDFFNVHFVVFSFLILKYSLCS